MMMFKPSGITGRPKTTNNISVPQPVLLIINRLISSGFDTCLVGGCVRDIIMGKLPDDYDIATAALPEQVEQVFSDKRVIKTGMKHGTVTVLADNYPIEITTYRTESVYSDHRHPDNVCYTTSLLKDLARRDFTFNAIAFRPGIGLIDPFNGASDIEKRILRCVGNPDARFSEDALRILRAVRFSSVLGFKPEHNTASAANAARNTLKLVSAERISAELSKLICGDFAGNAITEFSELLTVIIPELPDKERLCALASAINSLKPEPALRLAFLLIDLSPEAADTALRRMKYSNAVRNTTVKLIAVCRLPVPLNRADICRMLSNLSPELFPVYTAIRRALYRIEQSDDELRKIESCESLSEHIIKNGECYSLKQLAVSGNDLLNAGIPPGKKIGFLLKALLDNVIEGEIKNEKQALLEYLPKLKL